MRDVNVIRGVAVLILAVGAMWGQTPPPKPSAAIPYPSALPATTPTEAPAPKPLTPDQLPPHRAVVRYHAGRLSVEADNSSLNQILWAIGREMGMKITGGVVDERVYGTYGPDDPARILTTLLDGTGSNMLLKESLAPGASELVLTPRGGGPAPPGPTPGPDVAEELKEDLPPQQLRPRVVTTVAPAAVPAAPPAAPPATAAQTTPSAALPTSPNGVKTPQQIYEQLLKLQQQQPKTPPQ